MADLSNFYLVTPLKRPEYGQVKLSDIPDEIINEYKLHKKAIDGWVCFKVMRGMWAQTATMNSKHDSTKRVTSKAFSSLPYGSTRHGQPNSC